MLRRIFPLALLIVASAWVEGLVAQVADPIPAPITKQGLRVELKDIVRLPDSRAWRAETEDNLPNAWARVTYVRDLPDGRRFANDSRGRLYRIDQNNQPVLYLDLTKEYTRGFYKSLESGFVCFTFHPDFARNGLFYTVFGEKADGNPGVPDFIPPGFTKADLTFHTIITEWHATNPAAVTFSGTKRELLRVGHVTDNYVHPLGALEFNPAARPGTPDYGLLYIGGGDWGFSNGGGPRQSNPKQTQRLDTLISTILRIDPRSPRESRGIKGVGDYTVPPSNPFVRDKDPKKLGEIYAYGFRNAHRLSWDLTDGTMFASDIGMSNIEEIDIVRPGLNYGWMQREGPFDNGAVIPGGQLAQVYPLSRSILDGSEKDGFVYPVAIYDHGEGASITAGFVYRGKVPALRGKFVFGDIQRGRVFAADVRAMKAADDGIPQTVAPIEEIQLFVRDSSGATKDLSLKEIEEQVRGGPLARADLQISESGDGEILLTTREDGMIRMLVP